VFLRRQTNWIEPARRPWKQMVALITTNMDSAATSAHGPATPMGNWVRVHRSAERRRDLATSENWLLEPAADGVFFFLEPRSKSSRRATLAGKRLLRAKHSTSFGDGGVAGRRSGGDRRSYAVPTTKHRIDVPSRARHLFRRSVRTGGNGVRYLGGGRERKRDLVDRSRGCGPQEIGDAVERVSPLNCPLPF